MLFAFEMKPSDAFDWTQYKARYLTADGRIVDFNQASCSHSEGQGYGLLLALSAGDRSSFVRIHKWTKNNLMVRQDALCAWKWGQRPNGQWAVIDYNNATDGDLLIAYALYKAGKKWNQPAYADTARRMVSDIRVHLAVRHGSYTLLLPGYFGFSYENGMGVNPGYFFFPAFEYFASIDKETFWQTVQNDSLAILTHSAYSPFKLPPDWLRYESPNLNIAHEKGRFFGYEAIRVPLYLAWNGQHEALKIFSSYIKAVRNLGFLPRRVDLMENSLSLDQAPAGFYAVFGRCARLISLETDADWFDTKADQLIQAEDRDYYSATLYLLARVDKLP